MSICECTYCHLYTNNHPICKGCPIYHKAPKKELKIYWCNTCDKIHRKSSKLGKEHLTLNNSKPT